MNNFERFMFWLFRIKDEPGPPQPLCWPCDKCGALILTPDKELHAAWHAMVGV